MNILNFRKSKLATATIFGLFISLITGCHEDSITQATPNEIFDLRNYDPSSNNNINKPSSKSSYPTASYTHGYNYDRACPKLLQKEVDSSLITRTKEHMHYGQYCDYYIYPKVGQSLSISSYNSKIEVILIMPEFYDFANGPYPIEANRRHVIRVKYNGIDIMPDDFVYDIDFSLD